MEKSQTQAKIILIGDPYVGKTSIVNRFLTYDKQGRPSAQLEPLPSTKVNVRVPLLHTKIIDLGGGKSLKMFLHDTAGAERYSSITQQYYRNSDAVILVYDLTDEWREEALQHVRPNAKVIIVGNKCDKQDRKVTEEAIKELSTELGKCDFIEVSAFTGYNISEMFLKLAGGIVQDIPSSQQPQSLDQPPLQGKQKQTSAAKVNNEKQTLKLDGGGGSTTQKSSKGGCC